MRFALYFDPPFLVISAGHIRNNLKCPPGQPLFSCCTCSLQADATYLIVNDQNELEKFGLNAVCTHLGCVVPWDTVRSHSCSQRCLLPPWCFARADGLTDSAQGSVLVRHIPLTVFHARATRRTRTSSSAHATAASTTSRARSSEGPPRCRSPSRTAMSQTTSSPSRHGEPLICISRDVVAPAATNLAWPVDAHDLCDLVLFFERFGMTQHT